MLSREEFNKSVQLQLNRIDSTLTKKNTEYATDDFPLHNFYESAKLLRSTPKEAAFAFMVKHLTSITDMVQSNNVYPLELWQEKLGDAKNYLVLIECLIEEELDSKI